jgi:hypothetical protein
MTAPFRRAVEFATESTAPSASVGGEFGEAGGLLDTLFPQVAWPSQADSVSSNIGPGFGRNHTDSRYRKKRRLRCGGPAILWINLIIANLLSKSRLS